MYITVSKHSQYNNKQLYIATKTNQDVLNVDGIFYTSTV